MSVMPRICYWGLREYHDTWQSMQLKNKDPDDRGDVWWVVEHPPVYTLGSQGGMEHLHANHPNIPIIQTDRGGSITYHGPGQLVLYPQLYLRSHTAAIAALIDRFEQLILAWIRPSIPHVHTIPKQRGCYIDEAKIASIGLRIANGKTYHGISININMDLTPFDKIDPCGYPGLRMTQWTDHAAFPDDWAMRLESLVCDYFGYTEMRREYHDTGYPPSQITWPRQTV